MNNFHLCLKHQDRPILKAALMEKVWGYGAFLEARYKRFNTGWK